MLSKFKSNIKGFTLIELMVVMGIIAILVTILIVAINPIRLIQNATDNKRRSDLNQIKAAMQLYYNDCKYYPTTIPFGAQFGPIPGGDPCDDNTTYMKQVPSNSGGSYLYTPLPSHCSGTNCTDYLITADLNNPNADDTLTLSKCGAIAGPTVDFAVCND